ncbi:MAG: hypothetical protein WCA10_05015, partial [Terracidiphilus sp.]
TYSDAHLLDRASWKAPGLLMKFGFILPAPRIEVRQSHCATFRGNYLQNGGSCKVLYLKALKNP